MKGVYISKACGYDGVGNKIIKWCGGGFLDYFIHFITCPSHLVSTRANGSVQMLFLYLKMTTVNSKWITVLFLCWQVFPRSVKELCSFICITSWWKLAAFFINSSRVSGLMTQQLTNWFFLFTRFKKPLEGGREVRVVFLDISKAFDKVWHTGLLRKLEALGVQSPLLQWLRNSSTCVTENSV